MIEFVYKNEAAIRLFIFITGFLLLALAERYYTKRQSTANRARRWLNNLGLVVLSSVLLRAVLPVAAVGVAYLVEQGQVGLINQFDFPFWTKLLIAIILLDLSIFLQHCLFHAIPVLWRVHRVHHSDLDCDVSTGLRFHPIEIILSILIKMIVIVMLGAPVLAVIIFEAVLNFMSMFSHSNIQLNRKFEKILRCFVVTPDMHHLHHSAQENETNSNFGFNISLWDRVFGTYIAEPSEGQLGITVGLDHFREGNWQSFWGLLRMPFAINVRGYAINYRDTKNADDIAMAKKIEIKNVENKKLLKELNRLNGDLASKVISRTQQLKTAKGETAKAEKANTAKTNFLSNMSHELRTPLNAIIGYAELLLEEDKPGLVQTQRTDMERIQQAGRHLLELINEILDLAKLESGKVSMTLQAVDIFAIIEETLLLVMPMASARDIHTHFFTNGRDRESDKQSVIVIGDEKSLREVMLNLFSNAIKYNKQQGAIKVSADCVAGGRLRISVADTGRGISTLQQQELFKPFSRIDIQDAIEGTGIGLTICKKLVELMRGDIGMFSNTHGGATFWFEIPLSDVEKNQSLQISSRAG
ncbi:MAG: sterol desaturase family protein [Thiohalomonadales bacterium]